MVANGFRAELLALVGNDAIKLDRTLAKIGSKISSKLCGEDIRRQVRAEFTRQVDYDDRDERKVRAIEQRGAPVAYKPKPTSAKPNYAHPSEDPENIAFLKSIGVKLLATIGYLPAIGKPASSFVGPSETRATTTRLSRAARGGRISSLDIAW